MIHWSDIVLTSPDILTDLAGCFTHFLGQILPLCCYHTLIRWAGGRFRALGSFWWFPGKSNMAGWRNVGKSSTLKLDICWVFNLHRKSELQLYILVNHPIRNLFFLSCTYVIFQLLLVNSAFRWIFSPLSLEITSLIVQHRLNPPSFQISSH